MIFHSKFPKAIVAIEKPIKYYHEDYSEFYDYGIRIYKLFNIMQTITNKPQYKSKFEKAFEDIKQTYNYSLSNFSYSNPGEQPVTTIIRLIKKTTNDR